MNDLNDGFNNMSFDKFNQRPNNRIFIRKPRAFYNGPPMPYYPGNRAPAPAQPNAPYQGSGFTPGYGYQTMRPYQQPRPPMNNNGTGYNPPVRGRSPLRYNDHRRPPFRRQTPGPTCYTTETSKSQNELHPESQDIIDYVYEQRVASPYEFQNDEDEDPYANEELEEIEIQYETNMAILTPAPTPEPLMSREYETPLQTPKKAQQAPPVLVNILDHIQKISKDMIKSYKINQETLYYCRKNYKNLKDISDSSSEESDDSDKAGGSRKISKNDLRYRLNHPADGPDTHNATGIIVKHEEPETEDVDNQQQEIVPKKKTKKDKGNGNLLDKLKWLTRILIFQLLIKKSAA
jgi:hypothetical protein